MTDNEIKAKVEKILQQNESEGIENTSVLRVEAIMVTLTLDYAESLMTLAVSDPVGTELYHCIDESDLLQESVNMNYKLYGEPNIHMNLIDRLFLDASSAFWTHYVMETGIGLLTQMPKNTPNQYQKMQILVAEQYVLEEKLHNEIMNTKLKMFYQAYTRVMEKSLDNFDLNVTDIKFDDSVYTREEIIKDLKYSAIAEYLSDNAENLQLPLDGYVNNISAIGKYELPRIMNYSSILYLSNRFNINVLDLKDMIKENQNK